MRKLIFIILYFCDFLSTRATTYGRVVRNSSKADSNWITREVAYVNALANMSMVADLSGLVDVLVVKDFLNKKAMLGRPQREDLQLFDPSIMNSNDRIVLVPVFEVDVPFLSKIFNFKTRTATYLHQIPSIWFRVWNQDNFESGLILIHEGLHAMQLDGRDPNQPIDIIERVTFETEAYGLQCKILRAIGGSEYIDTLEMIIDEIESSLDDKLYLDFKSLCAKANAAIKVSVEFENKVDIGGLYLWIDANFLKIERDFLDNETALLAKLKFMNFQLTKGVLRYQ